MCETVCDEVRVVDFTRVHADTYTLTLVAMKQKHLSETDGHKYTHRQCGGVHTGTVCVVGKLTVTQLPK